MDLGTTRVVLRIVDLATGEHHGEVVFDNPQISVGPDVLARIHHVETPGGLDQLNRLIIEGINTRLHQLCHGQGISPQQIHLVAIAGNTAMTHLLLGLTPRWMIREPYIPAVNQPEISKCRDLGLDVHPGARAMVFPNVGSYFGGDLIAGILYCDMDSRDDTAILVDVGTNAEVVLGNRNWMMACAGAAGPALEGGVSRMGTTAGPGVIDRIAIDPETLQFDIHTIEDQPAKGICGSGCYRSGSRPFPVGHDRYPGQIAAPTLRAAFFHARWPGPSDHRPRRSVGDGQDLCITQADLDSLIRSKAAMYTILETITATVGMQQADLETFFVAGTFGAYIDPQSAITIGMIPDLALNCYQSLGNSSLGGATRVLTEPGLF